MILTDKVRALAEEVNEYAQKSKGFGVLQHYYRARRSKAACREYSGILRGMLASGVSTTDHWTWEPVVGVWKQTLRSQ